MREFWRAILQFEHKSQPLLGWPAFKKRLGRNAVIGFMVIIVSLLGGMAGYHYFEGQSCDDAFVNAAMILSGMGPLGELKTTCGKIFAGCYALYSGFAVLAIIGIIFAPVVHRFLHHLHAEDRGH
jgi:hypothetical protein